LEHLRLSFDKVPEVASQLTAKEQFPVIREGSFDLKEVGDTYLNMRSWGKGHVWINGHNFGRYWHIGPQQTIYVPAPWLREGINKIVVFEELKPEQDEIESIAAPILNELQNK